MVAEANPILSSEHSAKQTTYARRRLANVMNRKALKGERGSR
jgi:hypothetical protein